MVDYFGSLWESVQDLWRKPVVFIPMLFQLVANMALLFVLAALGAAAMQVLGLHDLSSFVAALPFVIPAGIVAILAFIALNVWFAAGTLGIVDDVVERRATSRKRFFATANSRVGSYFVFALLQLLFILLLALPASVFLLLAISNGHARIALIVLAILFGLVFIAGALLLSALFYFGPAFIIRHKTTGVGTITACWALFKARSGHVFASWGVNLLFGLVVGLGLSMLFGLLSLPVTFMEQAGNSAGSVINFILNLIQILLEIAISIVSLLFLFRMHRASEPMKSVARPKNAIKKN